MAAPALLMKLLPMIAGKSGGSGSLLPAAVGGTQLLMGHIQRAKAKKMQPGLEDPMQVTAMQEYQRRANNAMTGANISNQMRDLAQMQGAGIRALSRGGNINQFGQVSRMQSKSLNDILAQGQAQEQSYRNMFNQALENVADRRLRLQTRAADAMSLRSEKNIAAGTQGIMAGLAKMGGGNSSSTKTTDASGNNITNLPTGNQTTKIGGSLNLGDTDPMQYMMGGGGIGGGLPFPK